jgi:hypothetical protein
LRPLGPRSEILVAEGWSTRNARGRRHSFG